MEVKPGFKRTEVGPIPDQWNCLPLGNIIAPGTSITYGIVQAGPYVDDGIPYIKTGDMSGSRLPIENLARTSKRIASRYPRSTVRVGELVYSIRASVGAVHCVPPELDGANLTQGTARISPSISVDAEYLLNALRSTACQKWITLHTKGTTYREITLATLRDLPVPLPPTKAEQEAIAEALSDADAFIESLEQLVAKKRQLKQGAMQALLTGKKRLAGFSGDWEVKQLGTTAILKARIGWQGLTTAEYLESGEYYLVTGTEFKEGYIDWDNCHYVDESRYKQDKYIQLNEHDVLVTKDGTIGKVALVTALPRPATLNSGVFVIRPVENAFHPEFFYYLLRSNVFTEFLGQLSAGSTINHLYQKDFVSFIYKTPAAIEEQIAIAAIFSDMDAEIAELEAKLAKARQLKQGMMHELLTGRIRLV